jgi:hypothetical protein
MRKSMKVKQIPFPVELIEKVEKKRKKIGIGFPEYIRHLVLNDLEKDTEEYVTRKEENSIGKSLKDYEEGRYTVLESEEDIDKHFNKVLDD